MSDGLKTYPCEGGGVIVTDLRLLPICRLKKLRSDDGYFNFDEARTFIGKLYKYSGASRQVRGFHNARANADFEADTVLVYDDRGLFAAMPVECLDLDISES